MSSTHPLRLLYFVPDSIYPVSHGGASRITNILWGMSARGHEVHVLSLVGDRAQQAAMHGLPNVASSESHVIPPDITYLTGGPTPTMVRRSYRTRIARRMRQVVEAHGIDLVQLEYTHSAAYIPALQSVPVVLAEHDVSFTKSFRMIQHDTRLGAAARHLFDSLRMYDWELRMAQRADLVLATSDREAATLRRRGVANVSSAVPNGVDVARLEPRHPRHEAKDILFVGNFKNPPNADGLRYFMSSVWPLLRDVHPSLTVSVVGPDLQPALAAQAADLGFACAGYVDELAAEFWSHKVFIVPIRYGAGTRIKALEAAAAKCAMVSTRLGVEGIGLRDAHDVLIADRPEDFARAISRLLGNKGLRAELGSAAHGLMRQRFDWPALCRNLENLCFELLRRRTKR